MPLNITDEIKQQILDANDIVDVIEEFFPLKKNGANYKANCPFHREKTPSFVVSRDKQIFHCFGCGKSGDVITFVMEYRNWTYIEAVEYLASRVNIVLEEVSFSKADKQKQNMQKLLYSINREAALFFYKTLTKNQIPIKYLKNRGINPNIIRSFGIGYAINQWDSLLNYLKQKGFKEEDILKTGLIIFNEKYKNYYDRFRNRIIFPIFDIKNNIIGFGGRVLDDSLPKYLNSPDSMIFNKGHNLYGLNIAKENIKDKYFFLVEGYMDVIKMHAHGFNTAVAALGTSLTENQIKLLKKYSDKFYICFDSDLAGMNAALRAINLFKKNDLDAKVIIIRGAKDPDEFLNKYGKNKFEVLASKALEYYEFLEYYYDKNKISNKVEYINKFFENLLNVRSDIEKELIIDKLAEKVGISKESLMSEFKKKYQKQIGFSNNSSNNSMKNNSMKKNFETLKPLKISKKNINNTTSEEELMKLILKENSLATLLGQIIFDKDFSEYKYLEIFNKIYLKYNSEEAITKDYISSIITEEFDIDNIFSEVTLEEKEVSLLFNDCYKRLKIKYLEGLKSKRNNDLVKINDEVEQNEMMDEILKLAKRIKSLKEEVD